MTAYSTVLNIMMNWKKSIYLVVLTVNYLSETRKIEKKYEKHDYSRIKEGYSPVMGKAGEGFGVRSIEFLVFTQNV